MSPALAEQIAAELAPLIQVIAARVAEHLSARASTPPHATAENNPLGSSRAFLRAARDGSFPSFRAGRAVTARWADVVAFLESRPITRAPQAAEEPPAEESPATDDDRRRKALLGAGVQMRAPAANDARRARGGSRR